MISRFIGSAIYVAASSVNAAEQPANPAAPAQVIARAGSQAPVDGPASFFKGRVRVYPLSSANADINASSAYVAFEPGAHSAWHTHPKGQYLVVTEGSGLTQEWGKLVQRIARGDVVWCPPGVKHWHGAAADSGMTHLAITGSAEGKSVTWMEAVSDEQYNAR